MILQYHNFGDDTPPSTSVTVNQFRNHLDYMEKEGFTVWPVEKIVEYLQGGKELPDRCVGITIDDASRSVYERAFPLMRDRGLPFTVFVPTDAVDEGYAGSMTWEQMKEMQASGAVFASHGASHGYLVRRGAGEGEEEWAARVRDDIDRSLRRLEEELGSRPLLFAYPYGEYNLKLRDMVRGIGLVAFGQHSGALREESDFGALPRFPMASRFADMDQFPHKVGSLPLPVLFTEPLDPVLPEGVKRPLLRLKVEEGDYVKDGLACYGEGGEKIDARWTGPGGSHLEVQAKKPLPPGRSKYTCTVPHDTGGRFFWYSHLWIGPSE